jgi:hypothetical protein
MIRAQCLFNNKWNATFVECICIVDKQWNYVVMWAYTNVSFEC